MSAQRILRQQLSRDILQAFRLAREVRESEAAERLLQALEVLAKDDARDPVLEAAYLDILGVGGAESGRQRPGLRMKVLCSFFLIVAVVAPTSAAEPRAESLEVSNMEFKVCQAKVRQPIESRWIFRRSVPWQT